MGRSSKNQGSIVSQPELWGDDELPRSDPKLRVGNFRSLRVPLWTQNKARLIQAYLRLFEMITKHGTYIDGFAAPQEVDHPEMWSAKLVLEITPMWFRDFWLCDINPVGVRRLQQLRAAHVSANRRIRILEGDFNRRVRDILESGQITEKTATFALLDQRTFECEWNTVELLSSHKKRNKIELFYFFPTGWVDRSLAAVRAPSTIARVRRWWGRDDWRGLLGMDGTARAMMVARRFEDELKYGRAYPYPIYNARRGGRTMYHMIHATDHPDATSLMIRAYRHVSGRPELNVVEAQTSFDELWGNPNLSIEN